MRDDRTTKPTSPADEAAGTAARAKGGCACDAKGDSAVHVLKGDSDAQPGRTHFMYVLRCADQTLYTGYTTDVAKRLATHNAGNGAKYTAARRPVVLEACASFPTKHAAMSAEYHFKRLSREAKLHVLTHAEDDAAFAQALTQLFDLSD